MAIYDRAAARLREHDARWVALQEALAAEQEAVRVGPPSRAVELMGQRSCLDGASVPHIHASSVPSAMCGGDATRGTALTKQGTAAARLR